MNVGIETDPVKIVAVASGVTIFSSTIGSCFVSVVAPVTVSPVLVAPVLSIIGNISITDPVSVVLPVSVVAPVVVSTVKVGSSTTSIETSVDVESAVAERITTDVSSVGSSTVFDIGSGLRTSVTAPVSVVTPVVVSGSVGFEDCVGIDSSDIVLITSTGVISVLSRNNDSKIVFSGRKDTSSYSH